MSQQLMNFLFIVSGGGILIFNMLGDKRENPYLLILGLVLLMFGLYRATNYWVETKDDEEEDDPNNSK